MPPEVAAAALRDDPESFRSKVGEQKIVGVLQMKNNREGIAGLNGFNGCIGRGLGREDSAVAHGADTPNHILGRQGMSVAEAHARTKMKNHCPRIRLLPVLCQRRHEMELSVPLNESIEEQLGDMLRCEVGSHAWIEARRATFDEKDDGSRIALRRSAPRQKQQSRQSDRSTQTPPGRGSPLSLLP